MQLSIHRSVSKVVASGLLALMVTLGSATERTLEAQAGPSADPSNELTFTKDIAPILQENCQVCHQPGAIGPMSLMEYQDVRRYARRISRIKRVVL